MLAVDLHVHSQFSSCGLHTILELLEKAVTLGMKGIAITDHGPAFGGRLHNLFFDRFKSPYPDLTFYKGLECNIVDDKGTIDVPEKFMKYLDIILLGIHPNTQKGLSKDVYTDILIAAIEKNPCIDMITHPNDNMYPVDYVRLCASAADKGVAIELNNSRILYERSTVEDTMTMLDACKMHKCNVIVASDTHSIHELGGDESVAPIIDKMKFPRELLVTADAQRVGEFIRMRKRFKK